MTPADRQQVMDIAELQVNRYFDHYLTEVFPQQLDRMFESHNQDVTAHPSFFETLMQTERMVKRWAWMLAGMAALLGLSVTVVSVWSSLRSPG